MFLHFNNRMASCQKTGDPGNDGEYYWTWQVLSGNNDELAIAQGFSIRPKLDDGIVIRQGETFQDLNDPKFTIELPDVTIGETRKVRLDLFCWEHDVARDTVAIKRIFTNNALQKLVDLYEYQQVGRQDALKAFGEWLKEDSTDFLTTTEFSKAIPMVAIASTTLPVLTSIIQLLSSTKSDDLVGVKQVELFYTKVADRTYLYRWLGDNGIEEVYRDEHPPIWNEFRFERADGRELMVTKCFFQIIFDLNTEIPDPA
jgi:hypothetical protein